MKLYAKSSKNSFMTLMSQYPGYKTNIINTYDYNNIMVTVHTYTYNEFDLYKYVEYMTFPYTIWTF